MISKKSQEDHNSDCDRNQGGNEDSSGGDILRPSDTHAMLGGDLIGKKFEGCVESLRNPDQGDAEKDGNPLGAAEVEKVSGNQDGHGGDRMNPGMRLGSDQNANPPQSIAEAADAGLEKGEHGASLRCFQWF
jgi:hypothetical protein